MSGPNARAGAPSRPQAEATRAAAVVVLVGAASIPLARAFVGWEAVRSAVGAALVATAVAWGVRRLGLGRVGAALASAVAWVAFTTATLAAGTGRALIVPTSDTIELVRGLVLAGLTHAQQHAAPVEPHPGLLVVVVAGTWLVTAVAADALVAAVAPLRALLAALVLTATPLVAAPGEAHAVDAALWVAPYLAASVVVLLLTGHVEPRGGGTPRGEGGPTRTPVTARSVATGLTAGGLAVAVAVPLGATLPGFGEPPIYETPGGTTAAVTTNPMVDLQPNLTSTDTGTVLEVTSPRPVYVRTTALEEYEDGETWTAPGRTLAGSRIPGGRVPIDADPAGQEISVEIEVAREVDRLVPVPYAPTEVAGEPAEGFLFDPRSATVTLDRDTSLGPGDRYEVTAVVPDPNPERLAAAEGFDPDGQLTQLPDDVPDAAVDLAARIVEEAGAVTPLEKALAIQEELRSWEYSLTPPYGAGHDGSALEAFLDTRVGYCEQYAGAMAVMLRSLDVPARVAVGFTPGTLVDHDAQRWEVTNENAHAWVEVLFPSAGWVSFEPTPRGDGNVLVPDGIDLAPADTAASDLARADDAADPAAETSPPVDGPEPELPEAPGIDPGEAGAEPASDADEGPPVVALAVAALAVAVGVALWWWWQPASGDALARVSAARRRVEHVAAGHGVVPAPCETDREYLTRVVATTDPRAHDAAEALASSATAVRFADAAPPEAAAEAERAAEQLVRRVAPGRLTRTWLRVRGVGIRVAARLSRR